MSDQNKIKTTNLSVVAEGGKTGKLSGVAKDVNDSIRDNESSLCVLEEQIDALTDALVSANGREQEDKGLFRIRTNIVQLGWYGGKVLCFKFGTVLHDLTKIVSSVAYYRFVSTLSFQPHPPPSADPIEIVGIYEEERAKLLHDVTEKSSVISELEKTISELQEGAKVSGVRVVTPPHPPQQNITPAIWHTNSETSSLFQDLWRLF